MRRRSFWGWFAVLAAIMLLVASGSPAEAGTVRDRIMAKRQAAGWDCSSGNDCSLRASPRIASSARAATPAPSVHQPAAAVPAPRAQAPTGGRRIEISLARQQLTLLEGNDVLLSTSVSTGATASPTPTGTFSILSKELRHWSTQHHVWMPYAMRVVRGIFIHEVAISPDGHRLGVSEIGDPASHGCVRVPMGTAARLYDASHVGMPVHIY
jgi:hypothetical protein